MDRRKFVRVSGLAAVAGGVLWSLFAVLASTKPLGCVGATCIQRPMRETTDLAPLMLGAVVLLLVGFVGLLVFARREGRFGKTMRAGAWLASLGAAVLAVALAIQALFYAGDFPAMPAFVIPAAAMLGLGILLIGIAVTTLMPSWVGRLVAASAVAFAFANDQDARVLLYVPFGLAWMAMGWILWWEDDVQDSSTSTAQALR